MIQPTYLEAWNEWSPFKSLRYTIVNIYSYFIFKAWDSLIFRSVTIVDWKVRMLSLLQWFWVSYAVERRLTSKISTSMLKSIWNWKMTFEWERSEYLKNDAISSLNKRSGWQLSACGKVWVALNDWSEWLVEVLCGELFARHEKRFHLFRD